MNRQRFFQTGATASRDPAYIKRCQRECELSVVQGRGKISNPFLQLKKPPFEKSFDSTEAPDEDILNEQISVSELAIAQIDDFGSDFAKTSGTEYPRLVLTETETNLTEQNEEISGLKGELFRLRDSYVQDCLRKGETEQARRYSEETSIFELLRNFPKIIPTETVLFENLSDDLKKLFLFIKGKDFTSQITIEEDENYPRGISLSGENEAIFWFLELNDYFGLQVSSLTVYPGASDAEIERIVQIPGLNGLKSLDWTHSSITKAGVFKLFNNPIGFSLRRLILKRCKICPETAKALFSNCHLSRITHLDLSMTSLDAQSLLGLFAPKFPNNLRELNLSKNAGVEESIKYLKSSNLLNLRRLILSNCLLSDDSLRMMFFSEDPEEGETRQSSKLKLKHLEELELNNNYITERGVKYIAKAYKSMPSLRKISFKQNSIKDLAFFNSFPSLDSIDLTSNPTSFELKRLIPIYGDQLKDTGYKFLLELGQFHYDEIDLLYDSGLIGTLFEIRK